MKKKVKVQGIKMIDGKVNIIFIEDGEIKRVYFDRTIKYSKVSNCLNDL